LRNFSNLGEGATEDFAFLEEGSSADLDVGSCLEVALHLRRGLEVGVYLERGMVSVDACSLLRTGETCGYVGVSGFFVGESSDEDTVSSITGGPCVCGAAPSYKPLSS